MGDQYDVVRRAFDLAVDGHGDQIRKGSGTPYLAHLLSVAALVWEHGGSNEQAAAALLHDYVEDQGGTAALAELESVFADAPLVVEIVRGCSDAVPGPDGVKPPWAERKVAYLASLPHKAAHVLLVSAADKLHNARAIVADYRLYREEVWARFNQGRAHQLWYYDRLAVVLGAALPGPLTDELTRVVAELHGLVRAEIPGVDDEVAEVAAALA